MLPAGGNVVRGGIGIFVLTVTMGQGRVSIDFFLKKYEIRVHLGESY